MAAMTIDQCRGHIGHGVVYLPTGEEGVITSVNDNWAFVHYGEGTSQATDPTLLALLTGKVQGDSPA
jgi:hypothetical protein